MLNPVQKFVISAFVLVPFLLAQPAAVPPEYQDLYSALDQKLAAWDRTVLSQWNGSKAQVDFGAELMSAGCHQGLRLLAPETRAAYQLELTRLKSLGAASVTVCASFPILHEPFYQTNGNPGDHARMLAFYRQLAADVRAQGLKLNIKSGAMSPGSLSRDSGFNLASYYASLDAAQYAAGRTQVIVTLASQLKPDYLEIGAEPDTEAAFTGQKSLNTPSGWAALIAGFVESLAAQGLSETNTAAGAGAWLPNASDYLRALNDAAPGLKFFALHVYPVNGDAVDKTLALIDLAASLGKPVTILEAWMYKQRESETSAIPTVAEARILARDSYSFFAPLDQHFLCALVKTAHWKQVRVLSAAWSRLFWSYVDYAGVADLSPAETSDRTATAATDALTAGTVSDTGAAYKSLIGADAFSPAITVNSASFRRAPVAPGSLVAIGGSFIPKTAPGSYKVTVTDSARNQAQAAVSFAGVTQINAVLPPGLAAGSGTLSIEGPGGATWISPIGVAPVSPAIFSANNDGRGPAVGVQIRVAADGSTSAGQTFQCPATGACTNLPIDLSDPTVQVYAVLYGTGFRNRSGLEAVFVRAGGLVLPVQFAGRQPEFPGLDQVNFQLPSLLEGKGEVSVQLVVEGVVANSVTLAIR